MALPTIAPSPDQGPFTAFLRYDEILWSADGQQLALPFFVQTGFYEQIPPYEPFAEFGYVAPPAPTLAGVLLADVANGSQRVITAPYRDSGARLEWDLTSGRLVSSSVTLPPALSYQWGANGALLPQEPLNTTTPPTTPPAGAVGNPTGSSQFSIWQPGVAAPGSYPDHAVGTSNGPPPTYLVAPNLYLWYSRFGAWSPDGRYLLTSGFLGGRVAPAKQPAPTQETLAKADAGALPVLPARDAVLDDLLSPTNPAVASAYTLQFVAWQPSGVEVAVVADDEYNRQGGADVAHPIVTLYDGATARHLAQLQPQENLQPTTGDNILTHQNIWLQWSPEGKHLLLLDNNVGTLTIWTPPHCRIHDALVDAGLPLPCPHVNVYQAGQIMYTVCGEAIVRG